MSARCENRMTSDSYTPEMIARADEIVNAIPYPMNGMTRQIAERAALAAIKETTERATKVAKEYAREAMDSYHEVLMDNAAEAIRLGDHLK